MSEGVKPILNLSDLQTTWVEQRPFWEETIGTENLQDSKNQKKPETILERYRYATESVCFTAHLGLSLEGKAGPGKDSK